MPDFASIIVGTSLPAFSVYLLLIALALAALILFVFRPVLISRRRKHARGLETLVGRNGVVESTSNGGEGSIMVHGELWRAKSLDSEIKLVTGMGVRIVGVRGHLLTVEPLIDDPPRN